MSQPQHIADRYSLSTALFGMMVLALGMGIGRFLYTPMLPVLLAEGRLAVAALTYPVEDMEIYAACAEGMENSFTLTAQSVG